MPLHAAFICATLPFRPASPPSSTATCARPSRMRARACAQRTDEQPSSELAPSKRASLAKLSDTPAIFNGPEAVLGVLLAAAALLADFVRNVARLSAAGTHSLDLRAAESSVAELKEALRISKEVLHETDTRLSDVSTQRDDAQHALLHNDRMREKMESANLFAQRAEQQLQRLKRSLTDVRQKRSVIEQQKESVDEERQRIETQIAEKRLLLDKLTGQIEGAKTKEREIKQQLKAQQQLLEKQAQQSRRTPPQDVSDAEEEELPTRGGDPARSEMNLDEVKRNLRAEKLALSAEIREAQAASQALSEEVVDELQFLRKQIKAKRDEIRARLKKAKTTVDREEREMERREQDIDMVLDSIANNDDEDLFMDGIIENAKTVKKRARNMKQEEVVEKDASAADKSESTEKEVLAADKGEIAEKEVSAAGKSKATAKKARGKKKSIAEDVAVEETQSTGGEEGVQESLDTDEDRIQESEMDTSKEDAENVKAVSTSDTKEVKKRTRTRKRAGSSDSSTSESTATATKTKTRKSTRKKRSAETNEDQPLTVEELKEVRKAVMDLVDQGVDLDDLASGNVMMYPRRRRVAVRAPETVAKDEGEASRGSTPVQEDVADSAGYEGGTGRETRPRKGRQRTQSSDMEENS